MNRIEDTDPRIDTGMDIFNRFIERSCMEKKSYQYDGVKWLLQNELRDDSSGGFVADEMGLGKTIQTISMIASLACDKGIWGPHLIVVPTTIIINWEMEFKKWCPALKILTYFGS